jgi:sec-independent protein translocase protein TatB
MFGLENLDGPKLIVLLLLGIFIFGPDKLPKAIADGVRMLRTVRDMARNATSDLSRELGTDIQLEDLNPKALIRKHLLSEEDERALRKPIEDLYKDVQKDLKSVSSELKSTTELLSTRTSDDPTPAGEPEVAPATPAAPALGRHAFDAEAT